ncbi:MAG TPA: hypothetical protein EYG98_06185 [Sulfurovum sp.]|nr:hypothetical protein [Sulfurovum sp.]
MAKKSISLEFPWTQDNYIRAGMIAYNYKMNYSYKKYVGWFFIGLILAGMITTLRTDGYALLYLGVILSIYWYYIRGMTQKSRLKKTFLKEGISGVKMKFNIDSRGVYINGNFVPWSQVSLVVVHPNGFLLERPEGYPFLPADAFEDDSAVESFLQILEKNDIILRHSK